MIRRPGIDTDSAGTSAQHGNNKILRAVSFTFTSSIVTIASHFVTMMILIRVLDQVGMGIYFMVLMIADLLVLMSDFGINLALVKRYPEETEADRPSLVRAALVLRLAICSLFCLAALLVIQHSGIEFFDNVAPHTTLLIALFLLHAFRAILISILQAAKRFADYALTLAFGAIFKVVLIALLAMAPLQAVSISHVLLIENVALLGSTLFAMWRIRSLLTGSLRVGGKGGRDLIAFGFPLYLNALLNLGNERVSQYIVASLGGPAALAKFSVAAQLANAGQRLFGSFTNVYLPVQTGHFAAGRIENAKHVANRSMLWTALIIGTGTLVFAVLRNPLVELIFTEKYLGIAPIIVLFLIALMFRSLQVVMGYFSVAAGYNYFPVRVSMISSVFNVVLTWLMFHWYGYEGAVISLMITQMLIGTLYYTWLHWAGLSLSIQPVLAVIALFSAAVWWILTANSMLVAGAIVPLFLLLAIGLVPVVRSDLREAIGWLANWRSRKLMSPSQ